MNREIRPAAGLFQRPVKGDRAGQHSVRINGQWRICFVWTEQGPADIEIVADH
jgi:proteic killer suppression protein